MPQNDAVTKCRHRAVIVAVLMFAGTAFQARGQGQPVSVQVWSVARNPTVIVGDEVNVTFVRIAGVTWLESGEVVVADAGTMELRLFSRDGRYLSTLSRKGDGPGELRALNGITRFADTVFVFEGFPGPPRLHAFSVTGYLGRWLARASTIRERLSLLARLQDGSVLVESGRGFRVASPQPPGTLTRDTVRLGVLHGPLDNGRLEWLGEFPATSLLWYDIGPPSDRTALAQDALGAMLMLCTSGDRIWVGDSGTGEITVFASGTSVGRFILPVAPMTQSVLRQALQQGIAEATTRFDSLRVRAVFDRRRAVRTVPAFSRCIPGPDGEVWVERWPMPMQPKRMVVLHPKRGIVANVNLPASVTVYEIGENYVAASVRDETGAERAAIYYLERHR